MVRCAHVEPSAGRLGWISNRNDLVLLTGRQRQDALPRPGLAGMRLVDDAQQPFVMVSRDFPLCAAIESNRPPTVFLADAKALGEPFALQTRLHV